MNIDIYGAAPHFKVLNAAFFLGFAECYRFESGVAVGVTSRL